MEQPAIDPPPAPAGLVRTFRTARLVLRGVTEADAASYERYFVDWEVVRHLAAAVPWPYPPGGVQAFLRDTILPAQGRDRWMWGLFLREDPDTLVGAVDLWRPGRPEHRGFWLGRPFWGRGYMTEAVVRITGHAFDELGFDRLVFANAAGNARSHRIKERTGARYLGIEPARFVDPSYTHREIWELDRSGWEQWKRTPQASRWLDLAGGGPPRGSGAGFPSPPPAGAVSSERGVDDSEDRENPS